MSQAGHITISDETLSGIWQGLNAVAQERYELAIKALKNTLPTESHAILQAQLNAVFWEKTIPCIYEQYKDYVARKATQPPVNPAK